MEHRVNLDRLRQGQAVGPRADHLLDLGRAIVLPVQLLGGAQGLGIRDVHPDLLVSRLKSVGTRYLDSSLASITPLTISTLAVHPKVSVSIPLRYWNI